jgi:hypothetical protein
MAVHLDGVLCGVRFHPAVPVGFVSGIGQLPQCSGYRFKNLQQAAQLLIQLDAIFDARPEADKPQ